MWTEENRGRYDRSKLRYPSDLTDAEWSLLEPLIPPAKPGGNKREVDIREIINGILYVLSTGCQWQAIPKDLPPRSTVNGYLVRTTFTWVVQYSHCFNISDPGHLPFRLRSWHQSSPCTWGNDMSGSAIAAACATQIPTWLDWSVKLAIPILSVLGAWYTARQFARARRWRAGDLAAGLVAEIATNDELAFACESLDWGVGPMIVPQRYRPLLVRQPKDPQHPTAAELGQVMDHDPALLAVAIEVRLNFDFRQKPEGLVYRNCFDKPFQHLSKINRLLEVKQVYEEDLVSLRYWLACLMRYEYHPTDVEPEDVFQPFIAYPPFGYLGIADLARRLGVEGWKEV